MYPPSFDYAAPHSLDQAMALLAEHGDEAKLLSGGQSLIPLLKLRFAAPAMLIDLNRVPGLEGMDERDGTLHLGALTRHAAVAEHATLGKRYPLMASAAPQIADPLIRNLGTIGGSLAHADPAGDWGSVLLALHAEVVAESASGQRVIPVRELFLGMLQTALLPTEILTGVRVPAPVHAPGGAYLKLERKVGDFATVGVAVHIEMAGGVIRRAGIGLTAVGTQNLHAQAAEEALIGQAPGAELFAHAAALAADLAEPTSDIRGSAEYKRDMVRVYVERGLRRAVAMANA